MRNSSARPWSLDQWLYFFAIASLSLGGVGGSLQPSRLLSVCLLPYVLVNLQAQLRPGRSALDKTTVMLAASLVFLAALSVVWSYDPGGSVGYTVVLCINLLPLLYIASLAHERRAQLRTVTLLAWLTCLALTLPVAFYELTTGNHFQFAIEGRGGGDVAIMLIPFASVFFGNFNDYSLFVTLCVTILLSFSAGGTGRARFLLFVPIVLALVVLTFNSSRGALGATLVVIAVRLAASFGVARVFGVLAVAVLALLGMSESDDSPLLTLVLFKFTDVSDDLTNDDGRLAIIMACLQGLADSYGLGLGANGYGEYLSQYFPNIIPNPHNLVLELALNFSLLGLLIFSLHAVTLLRRFFSKYWASEISGSALALRTAPLLLLPLIGVVQSHLTGYTYFWYWYSAYILLSLSPPSASPQRH